MTKHVSLIRKRVALVLRMNRRDRTLLTIWTTTGPRPPCRNKFPLSTSKIKNATKKHTLLGVRPLSEHFDNRREPEDLEDRPSPHNFDKRIGNPCTLVHWGNLLVHVNERSEDESY